MRVWGEFNRKMERFNYIFLSKIHSKFTKLSYNKKVNKDLAPNAQNVQNGTGTECMFKLTKKGQYDIFV